MSWTGCPGLLDHVPELAAAGAPPRRARYVLEGDVQQPLPREAAAQGVPDRGPPEVSNAAPRTGPHRQRGGTVRTTCNDQAADSGN